MKRIVLVGTALVFLLLGRSVAKQYRKEISQAYQRVSDGNQALATDNGKIEYSIDGEGTPVLLIHGAGGGYDQGMLMGQALLNDGCQLIAVSRCGYLGSPLVEDVTAEKQAMLYADLLTHLDIEKVMILGFSAGGPSAVQFAHDFPERSSALILVSAVSMVLGEDIPLRTKIVNLLRKSDFAYWMVLKTFRTQFLVLMGIPSGTFNSSGWEEKEFANKLLAFMHPMRPRRPGIIHEVDIKPLSGEEMSSMVISTIVLHAKDDMVVNYEHATFYHEHMTGSQLISFERGGHGMVPELQPMRDHINGFLKDNLIVANIQ